MSGAAAAPMQWSDLLNRPKPKPQKTIFYGTGPSQFAELYLPSGPGPHPVAVMIHGGCWQASVADRTIMSWAADDLRRRGIAVWNIEYRSVDQPGGGYPGTFQDVAAAIDRLQIEAPHDHITLKRVVAVGHSAGGQLALWSAARAKLPKGSVLHWAAPLPIAAVVDIAGVANLKTDTHTACGLDPILKLVGQPTISRPDVYSDTSPAALVPLGVPQTVIHASGDVTVPPPVGQAYAERARAAGDTVVFLEPPGNHVSEIAPGQPAWDAAAQAVEGYLKDGGAGR